MADQIPYRRTGPLDSPTFSDGVVLDLDKLRGLWRPWLDLDIAPDAHSLAGNAAWLWRNANSCQADQDYARPWTSLTAAGGLRSFVLEQCRWVDALGADRADTAPNFKELNSVIEKWVFGKGLRRLQGVAILGALTATASFSQLEIPDATSKNSVDIHTAYEIARSLRARNPFDVAAARVMDDIAANNHDPRLALMAIVNLITLLVRFSEDEDRARSYLTRANELRLTLSADGEWLDWHIINNLYRIRALLAARSEGAEKAADEIMAAEEADRLANRLAKDDYAKHIVSQSHMLLVGVKVRLETRSTGNPERVRIEIDDLMAAAPYDFEQQPAIGDLYFGAGSLGEAAERYRAGAQGGAVQGAMAAFRAYECSLQAGDLGAAADDLALLQDLDARADVNSYLSQLP